MTSQVIRLHPMAAAGPRKPRSAPKGRQPTADALAEVRRLLGDAPRDRDLLIEHLHRINDAHGHLPDALLAALASEMRLSMAEVYETASFYHHFDIVKDGDDAPARLTVRVCESLSCAMAGSGALIDELVERLEARGDVRVITAPCIGRCAGAPAVAVGRHTIDVASPQAVVAAVEAGRTEAELPEALGYDAYVQAGGYRLLDELRDGRRRVDDVIGALTDAGLRGLGGA
ncbi:MAG TPA: NAD(P)H-dependent oxidoreductase subunit E, partial [Albitalea sp.]